MADQQNLGNSGEKPVGSPGGSRAQMSGAFKVDDSSLKALRKTWQGLTADVKDFNTEIDRLKTGAATIASVAQALGRIGQGEGRRVSPDRGSSQTRFNQNNNTVSSDLSTGTITTTPGQGPPPGTVSTSHVSQPSGPTRGSQITVGLSVGVVGALGSYTRNNFGSTVSMDYQANQMARGMNGGYSSDNKNAAWKSMANMGGYQNAADLQQGMGIANQQGFSYGTARGSAIMGGISSLAQVNPGAGLTGAAAGYAGMYSPQGSMAMMSMGMGASIGAGGVRKDPKEVARSVLTRIFRGRMPTPQEMQEGMQPGAPLYRTLQQFPPETQQAIISVGMDEANGGKGRNDSILASQNLLGRAKSRLSSALGIKSSGMMQQGLGFMAGGTDAAGSVANNGFAGNTMALAGTGSMLGAGAGRSLLSVGGGMLGWRMGEGLFNRAAGGLDKAMGKGVAGVAERTVAGRVAGGLGSVAGMEAAKAAGATPVYVMNWPASFGGGGPGGGLKSAEKAGAKEAVKAGEKDVAQVAKAGWLSKIASGTPGVTGVGSFGALSTPFIATAAVGLGVGITAIKYGEAHSKASLAVKDEQRLSGDQLMMAQKQAEAWGLSTIPAWKAEYDRSIRPMVVAATSLPTDGPMAGATAALRTRAAQALYRLNRKFQKQGSSHLSGLVAAKSAANTAAASIYNSEAFGAPQISQGGGAAGPGSKHPPVAAPSGGNSSSAAVRVAEQYLGMSYVYGGTNPKTHFDCSGLTQWSYGQVGVKLPRTAAAQQSAYPAVPANQARAGDLVTFGTPAHHVGMYMGNGQMIDSPQTGDKIRIQKVWSDGTQYHRVTGGMMPSAVGAPGSLGGGSSTSSGSNQAPVSLGGPGSGSSGGMFVESNPSVEEIDALGSALSGGAGSSSSGGGFVGSTSSVSAAVSASVAPTTGTGNPAPNTVGSTSPAAPSNPAGNVALAKQMAAAYGWNSGAEWNALYALWNQESSFGTTTGRVGAAYGIPQADPGSKMSSAGSDWLSNPATQIKWGLNYIKGQYKDPIGAEAHKHSTDTRPPYNVHGHKYDQAGGWYEKGAWQIAKDHTGTVHKDEMVVPAGPASMLRKMAKVPGYGQSSGGGVNVTIHAPITLVGKASQQDAMDYVHMIEGRLVQSKLVKQIGQS